MGKNEPAYKKKQRAWLRNPNCHWCGIKMLEPKVWHKLVLQDKHTTMPMNNCTIDHLRHKLDGRPPLKHGERGRVLACLDCNMKRGAARVALLSPREMFFQCGGVRPNQEIYGSGPGEINGGW